MLERWEALPSEDASRNQSDIERVDHAASQALAAWRSGAGVALDRCVGAVRTVFAEIPSLDDDPEKSRGRRLCGVPRPRKRAATICSGLMPTPLSASSLKAIVQRATSRIDELNRDLADAAKDAKTLANALAGIVPHINGETCPVCIAISRPGCRAAPAHVATKIASLTSEAGRLQALATERQKKAIVWPLPSANS